MSTAPTSNLVKDPTPRPAAGTTAGEASAIRDWIYKPGQGYWMRVMTAGLVALVALALAGWLWQQGATIADTLPKSTYAVGLSESFDAPPGTGLDLFGEASATGASGARPKLGTASVVVADAANRKLTFNNLQLTQGELGVVAFIAKSSAPGEPPSNQIRKNSFAQGLPPVEPIYIQGGLAGVVLLLGAVLAYWLAGMRRSTVDFLVATDYEMKKVNWSTPREIIGSTQVVIGACILLAVLLFLFDFFFKTIFQQVGVIAKPRI